MPIYTGISSEAFRHPLDREAEKALRSLPGFDFLARKFVEFVSDRPQYVYHLGNSIQVGPRQYANTYHMFRDCVRDLDIYPEPYLFVAKNPISDAYALGEEQPSIILSSVLFEIMSEVEIRAVLANQLGHIKCGHNTLNQMAIWVMSAASFIGQLTFGLSNLIVTNGLLMAFYEWKRKSELSADRAALLIMDDINPVMSSMMKLAGGTAKHGHECSLDEFIRQSERYQELDRDGLNQVYKFLFYNSPIPVQGIFLGHPFLVERIAYVRDWAKSEQYRKIRNDNYQKNLRNGAISVKVETITMESDQPQPETEAVQPQPETEAVQPQPETEAVQPPPETEAVQPPPETEAVQPQPETEAVQPQPETEAVLEEILPITGVPKVEVTKILYKGKVKGSQADEYIEITNQGTAPADLSGWQVTTSGVKKRAFIFPKKTVLQPGQIFRVYTNEVHSEWGGFSFGSTTAVWNDTGGEGKLLDSAGKMVSGLAYDEKGNFTVLPLPTGS